MTTKYLQQAQSFMRKHEVTMTIRESIPQTTPLWASDSKKEEHGISYWVNLANRKTGKSYSFTFWDSVHNKENDKKPNAYDVLACLSVDDSESFEDFCNAYGYDTDSRTAEKTYKAVIRQNEGLRHVFSDEALQELSEIQ